jgi:hypothetical protein
MMEELCTSETSVNTILNMWRYNPEDSKLRISSLFKCVARYRYFTCLKFEGSLSNKLTNNFLCMNEFNKRKFVSALTTLSYVIPLTKV